jgi:hypothetical protein
LALASHLDGVALPSRGRGSGSSLGRIQSPERWAVWLRTRAAKTELRGHLVGVTRRRSHLGDPPAIGPRAVELVKLSPYTPVPPQTAPAGKRQTVPTRACAIPARCYDGICAESCSTVAQYRLQRSVKHGPRCSLTQSWDTSLWLAHSIQDLGRKHRWLALLSFVFFLSTVKPYAFPDAQSARQRQPQLGCLSCAYDSCRCPRSLALPARQLPIGGDIMRVHGQTDGREAFSSSFSSAIFRRISRRYVLVPR